MLISENLGTIITFLIIAWIIAVIIVKLARNKQSEKNAGCGNGCKGCSKAHVCRKKSRAP